MPTARELLEQADALMRRNRMGSGAEAAGRPATPGANPPTASPTSGPALSPRTIQREPIAPSVARTSLPVDPTESPVFVARAPANEPPAPAAPAARPPSQAETEAEFPVLTDAVDDAKAAAAAPLDDLADDVPLLTDAVEEIDVGIVDEAARGEPSFWELTARGETSVLGPAPDSIAVVPMPDDVPPVVPQSPPRGRDPLGLDQPPTGYERPDTTDIETPEPTGRSDAIPSGEAQSDADELAQREAPPIEPTEPNAASFTAEPSVADSRSAALDESQPAFSATFAEGPLEDAAEEAVAAADAGAESLAGAAPAARSDQPFTAGSQSDQQRIREIAEEIGMQVLQRIDIFTDTTLRAQLADRLRPVVDRAAADLVAAINEHLGELVRAQISEAIEREIESWRNTGR
jgi:ribonuclease E